MKYNIVPLFPSIVHQVQMDNYDDIRPEVISYIYKQKRKDPQGVSNSNWGGWQSADTYTKSDNILSSTVKSLLGKYLWEHNIISLDKDVSIINMWININNRGSCNVPHTHPNSHFSGVMWIKIPPKSGRIWFDSPFTFQAYDEINTYSEGFKKDFSTYLDYYFTPTEGQFLLFPSYLYHRVEPNESKEDRISLSFNIKSYDK